MNTTTDRSAARDTAAHDAALTAGDRWLVLRHRLRVDGGALPILGAGFFLAVTALTVGVSVVANEISISGWEVGTHLVRWFVGAVGVYLTAVYLPLYVVHGRTRAEVARQMAVFGVLYAALVAMVVAVGFALEGLVYGLADWPQALEGAHLFDAPDQYHLVLLEHTLLFGAWMAGGALLGAAFYRSGVLGGAMVPLAVAVVVVSESVLGPRELGPLPPPLLGFPGLGLEATHPALAAATTVACIAAVGAGTWLVVRDVPIRPETS